VKWQRTHKVHSDLDAVTADILVLKLQCNKRSAYIERPTPLSSKRRPHFETRACLGENKNLGHGSRGDWKPRMAKVSNNFTDRPAGRPIDRVARKWIKGLPETSENKLWSCVPWDSDPRITVLARADSNSAVSQSTVSHGLEVLSRESDVGDRSQQLPFEGLDLHFSSRYPVTASEATEDLLFAVVNCTMCKLVSVI
jgi:hypothetical protein